MSGGAGYYAAATVMPLQLSTGGGEGGGGGGAGTFPSAAMGGHQIRGTNQVTAHHLELVKQGQ